MGRILRIAQGNMGKSQVGGRCFIDMLYIRMQLRNNIYIYVFSKIHMYQVHTHEYIAS